MSEKTIAKNWSDEAVQTLLNIVGSVNPVTADLVEAAATQLDKSVRSIASKLRQLDREVASMAKEKAATFTEAEGNDLRDFVSAQSGQLTYKQIAENFMGGKFTAKQVQGKLLALELTGMVKPAEKVEAARSYTESEEAQFIAMANKGAFIEDIAAALNKTVSSVRGKALSLTRNDQIREIPKQKESHAKESVDIVAQLGDKIATMTVAEIAAAADKTPRGLKTLLTRRGIDCADYKGAAKKAKAEAKAAA
jgi:HSP90 family molecular chaperone